MAKTAQLGLPLLMPSQAQKHVVVNEAIARLDAVAQLRVASFGVALPPSDADPGESYVVPPGATDAWADHVGEVATFINGGWVFVPPRAGWRAWSEADGTYLVFDGVEWHADAMAISAGGAATRLAILDFVHVVSGGKSNTTEVAVPSNALVIGVTGRVVAPIAGQELTSWRLGVAGFDDRYGSGLGTALGAFAHGLTGSPLVYYQPTPLVLTAEGGTFASGSVRLAVHMIELSLPRLGGGHDTSAS